MDSERRIIFHESFVEKEEDIKASLKSARSVIGQDSFEFVLKPRLLRVMSDARGSLGISFQQVNLRFLDNYSHGEITDRRGNYMLHQYPYFGICKH